MNEHREKEKVSFAPSIRRLPSYLYIIKLARESGASFISGTVIAQELNIESIQVRKDLAITGISGKPKKGYPINELIDAIDSFLGWNVKRTAVVVGAGNLGTALIGNAEFKAHGLDIVAAFDSDPSKIGKKANGVTVFDSKSIVEVSKKLKAEIGILTVPANKAQESAEALVEGGVSSIWNFTNQKLRLQEGISAQREDLSSGYAMLSVKMKNALSKNGAQQLE